LYNLNTEGTRFPALSLRGDLAFPVGSLAGTATRGSIGLLATRSWGRNRLHLNGAAGFGGKGSPSVNNELSRWWAGAAIDRTLFRSSTLLVAELHTGQATGGGRAQVVTSLGLRKQWGPTAVIDVGLHRRLSPSGPDFGVAIGVSYSFGLKDIMPTDPSPSRPAVLDSTPPRLEPRGERFYYPGAFNWDFLRRYPEAGRLFNAFDYGHAVLYERLLQLGDSSGPALEREYRYLTGDLLKDPPAWAVAEDAVAPSYSRFAWRARRVFDWAHLLHRQIYDLYADEGLSPTARDSLIERVTDVYLSNRKAALSPQPKAMHLMDEAYYSQIFRKREPAFNGLIWAYHWLQVGLYQPLVSGKSAEERAAGVRSTVARFWWMLEGGSARFPRVMPITATIAPTFAGRHPRAAAIFDNLHMMHDIISDILLSPAVPPQKRRAEIYAALREFQDSERNTVTPEEQSMMAEMMGGIEAMGGAPGQSP
jgi:hypothetical protein